jgi:hypothetical protein
VTFIPHTKSLLNVLPGAGASAAVGTSHRQLPSLRQIASSMSDRHNLLQPPNCLGLHHFLVPFSHCGSLLLSLCIIPILHVPPTLEALANVSTHCSLLAMAHQRVSILFAVRNGFVGSSHSFVHVMVNEIN